MPKFLLLGSVSFRKVFKFNPLFYILSSIWKPFFSIEIIFEYNIQDTADSMETASQTTAIATAMDNMTAVYEPQDGKS